MPRKTNKQEENAPTTGIAVYGDEETIKEVEMMGEQEDLALGRALDVVNEIKEDEENVESPTEVVNLNDETTTGVVTLILKKVLTRRGAQAIASANGIAFEELPTGYSFTAPYIRVTRTDVEGVLGRLTDAKWRMLFINRQGHVKSFNDYEFELGNPPTVVEPTVNREYVQINTRLEKTLKEEVERYSALLNLSQSEFIAQAVADLVAQIKAE